MKTIRHCFSVAVLVGFAIFFANLNPSPQRTTHLEAVQASQKVKTISHASLNKKSVHPVKPAAVAPRIVPKPKPPGPITSRETLMRQAGISQADWPAAERIITLESSWDINSVEPTTGACGLEQELPCGKSGCGRYDAVCELRWTDNYVADRYGGWWPALDFHLKHNWY